MGKNFNIKILKFGFNFFSVFPFLAVSHNVNVDQIDSCTGNLYNKDNRFSSETAIRYSVLARQQNLKKFPALK